MSPILFFPIAVLTCVLPSVSFGQQHSGQKDGGAAPPSVKFGELEAEIAGKQDASRDINKLFWAGAGIGLWVPSVLICIVIGGLVSETLSPSDPLFILPLSGIFGMGIGLIVGTLAPFIGIFFYAPSPPDEPLVGKPPEYVAAYTKAYQSKARGTRLTCAAAGMGATLVGGVAFLVFRSVF